MKKHRLLAGLLALLLLCLPLVACGDEEQPAPAPAPNNTQTPPPPAGGDNNGGSNSDSAPNTDPDADIESDPSHFLAENGYPMNFTVRFEQNGYGFDTASNTILNGSESVTYTFTADDFRDLYRCLDNANFWQSPLDLTYSKLTGSSSPDGPGVQYTLTVSTADQSTRTCYIDSAAMTRLADNPDVNNFAVLVNYLDECVAMYHENATA